MGKIAFLSFVAAQDSSFSTVLVGLVNMFSTILAVFLIDRVGRKGLIYFGVSVMIVCLVAIGSMFQQHVKGLLFVSVFLVYIFAQAISISAVVFVLVPETTGKSLEEIEDFWR